MTNQQPSQIQSPCISNCCLDEDDICLGCFRHIDEITGWHSADDNRRLKIIDNCECRKLDKKRKDENL